MNYSAFLKEIIKQGIEKAKEDYPEVKSKDELNGSLAAFKACKSKEPEELKEVFNEVTGYTHKAYFQRAKEYKWFVAYQLEVEWICNVVSARLVKEGKEALFNRMPTPNGVIKAEKIMSKKK